MLNAADSAMNDLRLAQTPGKRRKQFIKEEVATLFNEKRTKGAARNTALFVFLIVSSLEHPLLIQKMMIC